MANSSSLSCIIHQTFIFIVGFWELRGYLMRLACHALFGVGIPKRSPEFDLSIMSGIPPFRNVWNSTFPYCLEFHLFIMSGIPPFHNVWICNNLPITKLWFSLNKISWCSVQGSIKMLETVITSIRFISGDLDDRQNFLDIFFKNSVDKKKRTHCSKPSYLYQYGECFGYSSKFVWFFILITLFKLKYNLSEVLRLRRKILHSI